MERKIGEIFKYNCEWYQTVEAPIDEHLCNECQGCCMGGSHIFEGECNGNARKDGKFVIFKKLEKVGEPFSCNYYGDGRLITMQEYQLFDSNVIYYYQMPPIYVVDYKHKRIAIEVNKEDMGDNNDMCHYDELFSPGTVSNTKHLTKENMEEKKLNLKPFDLQKAKEGKQVYTRDGRKVRIVCFDRIDAKPILALIPSTDGKGEVVFDYFVSGKRIATPLESDLDLMMYPEKKEGWVNVYKGGLLDIKTYPTQKEALDKASSENYIATVKIEWEE